MAPPFPVSDHCDGWRFRNPRFHVNRTWREIWRWKRTSRPAPWPRRVALPPPPSPPAEGGHDVVTWLGHATVLVQTGAGTVLIDPVFSRHAGPFGRLGPRRVHPPGLALAALPPVDVVLLSHDHYDHCDLPSLARLAKRSPATVVLTPLGNGSLVRRAGFAADCIVERDWWQTWETGTGLQVTCTPARHWSNRLSGRRNHRLWSGFFLRAGERRVYCSGDTGYDDVMFHEVRRRCGAPDLALLPIGAYEPRWFMAAQHCNPAEAVQIHQDVGARRSIGVHWGTFQLTDEAREAPVEALAAARTAAGLPEEAFAVVTPGHPVRL